MKPDLKMDSFAKMDGGEPERLLRNGIISVITPIEQIKDDSIDRRFDGRGRSYNLRDRLSSVLIPRS